MTHAVKPHFRVERKAIAGGAIVCGIDEAGRGPWAGPVVAAAVILDHRAIPNGLNDSKKLTAENREDLFERIMASARVGTGLVSAKAIDELNILQATFLAMQMAVAALDPLPTLALVDGNRAPELSCDVETIVGGDALSVSIAAASIIAKVMRDRIMVELDVLYPEYGFAAHKGYGTAHHARALKAYGPCTEHRMSFKPVKAQLTRKN
jgi:ribonuclease HII